MVGEIVKYLEPAVGKIFIDGTAGHCGHSLAMLAAADCQILALDQDEAQLATCRARLTESANVKLIRGNFAELAQLAQNYGFAAVDGVLLDLGLSSWHLEESQRGFSFQDSEPLDMRYDQNSNEPTARELVNTLRQEQLAELFNAYGQERFAKSIARRIAQSRMARPIETSEQLVQVIATAIPGSVRSKSRKHFATRVFQALRIAVNRELANLEQALPQALQILNSGGVLVVISYHSLEDRIVKNYFRNWAREDKTILLTKKPQMPTREEVRVNSRAHSAKLRAIRKI